MEISQTLPNVFNASGVPGLPVQAQLYMATCTGLNAWSKQVGFTARHIGLAADPAARIKAMRAASYGGLSLVHACEVPFSHESGWDDWRLLPLNPFDEHDPEFPLEEGALQIESPLLPLDLVSRRLLMMLAPLEASRCLNLPSAIAAQAIVKPQRQAASRPRYTFLSSGKYAVVRDIYYYNSRMTDVLSAAIYGSLNAHTDGHAASSIGLALDTAVNGSEYVGAADLFV